MINVDKFIHKRNELLLCNSLNNTPVLHILLCFDNSYALSAGVDVISVIENNTKQQIHFHLFTHNISEENRKKFADIKSDDVSITEYVINDQFKIDSRNTEKFPIFSLCSINCSDNFKRCYRKVAFILIVMHSVFKI
ncbi:glycosyltransferase [Gilliamella intestini]|uniref:Glycosyl transferase family 8 n=1 Tax=Gilliamella intestini TaxID=1798183 RepID=A0A1C3ZC10_9GAMM|nr:Glycosyl transferase family 8 [Gilliamella intestini]